jgi:hypothetical protein
MTEKSISAAWSNRDLVIATANVERKFEVEKPWNAVPVDSDRIFAYSAGKAVDPERSQGFAKCSPDMLYDLIKGVTHRRWSGVIFVDAGNGSKRLFFSLGELVFASSELMDDRLGEVIYRQDKISLDQLTQFAVQVDRKTKFGQVLLRSGDFNSVDLWNALKLQVTEIFRGLFFVDQSYVEVMPGSAPIEVTFESGTADLLESIYSFGIQFRMFSRRMSPDVRLVPSRKQTDTVPAQGTFNADLMHLCDDEPTIKVLLERSKLSNTNTLLAIHNLAAAGRMIIEGLEPPQPLKMDGGMGTLKAILDSYQLLHGIASAAFMAAGVAFPIKDLTTFTLAMNRDGGESIYLDQFGLIAQNSELGILQQCAAHCDRRPFFQIRVGSLIRYLLQMSGDMLPYEVSKKLKIDFKEISS